MTCVEKVIKKYKLTNIWAILILVSISTDADYLNLPFPFEQGPYLVLGVLVFYAVCAFLASWFLQRVADETKL